MDVKRLVGLLLTGIAATAAPGPAVAGDAGPKAVLELFTSQGCSSCPPADALMNTLARDRALVTLTYPVDYWDYLGWKDTLARPEFSQRQRAYAAFRKDRAVYTPQMVVNGREHVVGSDRAAIDRSVTGFAGLPVMISLEAAGDVVTARIGDADGASLGKATIWLVVYDRERVVPIGRGENKGRQVTYSNVVRQLQAIGMWKGRSMAVELPRHDLVRGPDAGVAILLQVESDGRPGAILGAAVLGAPGI